MTNTAYKKTSTSFKKIDKYTLLFIGPVLEYTSVIWDGCSSSDSDILEKVKVQLHVYAARIITGIFVLAFGDSLYLETCLEPLSTRRAASSQVKVSDPPALLHKDACEGAGISETLTWEDGRATAKLVSMHKVHNNEVPQYLKKQYLVKQTILHHTFSVMEKTI